MAKRAGKVGSWKDRTDLAGAIEAALRLGEFISYNRSWDFVSRLEEVKGQVDGLLAGGQADRASDLYELFLAGCYEKADEIDDSGGNLGMFFEELFCGWIKARQAAGRDPAETVRNIVGWMDQDDYGFCFEIDANVALALDAGGFAIFRKHLEDRFELAFAPFSGKEAMVIYDYPSAVHMTGRRLKAVYVARNAVQPYIALCERTLASPKDCENIARLYKAKGQSDEAMSWIERGLAAASTRRWGNEDSHNLEGLKRELRRRVGRKDDAVQSAWSEFSRRPSAFAYEELMRYVPRQDRGEWHRKAMAAAKDAELAQFIELCVQTRELDLLAERVDAIAAEELEGISHYSTEKAATSLEPRHGLAAAKLRYAMAMRILDAGKSKYYPAALEHLRAARDLYGKGGQEPAWQSVVARVREDHSRKRGFMSSFEEIVAGDDRPAAESFEDRARRRWRDQTSG
ncbi:MAG: hypothetical protein PHU85_11385 [Phycisphaerae bacterium]|nr:hypothetical protein [Phycisphaerae bacterium]